MRTTRLVDDAAGEDGLRGARLGLRLLVCDDRVITFWTCNGPPVPWPVGRAVLGALEAPVLMVGTDRSAVEERLLSGMLACPGCGGGGLVPWGHARRRAVRHRDGRVEALRPRRGRCGSCRCTHVLLPVSCLLRRADGVAVIGAALTAKAAGAGHRRIAVELGRAASTVRGWLRRFTGRAEEIRVVFTGLLGELDPLTGAAPPAGTALGDAVDAVGRAVAAARRRLGVGPAVGVGGWSPWQLAAAVTAGRLLAPAGAAGSPHTSWPWAAPG